MTTTISVDDATLERFHELKHELNEKQGGMINHTSDSFLSELLNAWEGDGDVEQSDTPDDAVIERLDRNYEAIKEATDAAQAAEQAVDEVTQR